MSYLLKLVTTETDTWERHLKEQDKTQPKFDLKTLEMSLEDGIRLGDLSAVQRLLQGLGLSSMDLSVLIEAAGTEARLFTQVAKGRLEELC